MGPLFWSFALWLAGPAWAAACSPPAGLFEVWASSDSETLVFVSGANPYPGEGATLRRKCRTGGRNLAFIHPGTRKQEDASHLVGKLLEHVDNCVAGAITVACHSKGCDAVAESLSQEKPHGAFWRRMRVVFVNPLIPGSAKAWKIAGGWIWQIHPGHPSRERLFGAGASHLKNARSLAVLETAGDGVVARREDYGPVERWLAPTLTLSFGPDIAENRRLYPVDRENLALQWETDVSQLKDARIYGPDSAHAIWLFLDDFIERVEALRPAPAKEG